jgi:SNF2 family DNA or RNA helicase
VLEGMAAQREIGDRMSKGLAIYPYQIETALKVVNDLDGSAILADEVGLGKTIEAGLIRAELSARAGVQRTLVLAPAGLVPQWRREWQEKFGWPSGSTPNHGMITMMSLDTAKRPPVAREVSSIAWDLVVVDEAHHLKNPRTLNHDLVAGLDRRHLLLLTATPMENQLTELYNLVTLVKPGLFGSYLKFYRQFIFDKRTPKNATELRQLLAQVMVRHQRCDVGASLPPREVTLLPIPLGDEERHLYDRLTEHLRREYRNRLSAQGSVLPLLTMQRELCSSPQALLPTLRAADWLGPGQAELVHLAEGLRESAKARAVADLIRYLDDKVLVFTEFRSTQDLLVNRLLAQGIPARAFHGGVNPDQRQTLITWFRHHGRVLVSTEAGGQGINLQFCRHVVNFDLPWNPMRIEQRIGRVHRLGQERAVQIYNLFAMGTVEEDILFLLHEKIDLFRQVVGELDVILRHLEKKGKSLESRLLNILMTAGDRREVNLRMDQLAREFLAVRRRLSWPAEGPQETDGEVEVIH